MSTKIKLHYSKALDISLLEKGIEVWLRRITIQTAFKTSKGFTQPYEAIVDTGAPVSILPPAIWQDIEKEILGDYRIKGIVPKKDAFLPVKVANVCAALLDEHKSTRMLKIKAYLSIEPEVPLVLGFENFLSQAKIYSDTQNNSGYIEI